LTIGRRLTICPTEALEGGDTTREVADLALEIVRQ
jgi:hypothetical protein